MSKWFDANGTDVDAYPDRAFKGGVYERNKVEAQTINSRKTINVRQAMQVTGRSRRAIYYWVKNGKIECVRHNNKQVKPTRIYVDSLLRIEAKNDIK